MGEEFDTVMDNIEDMLEEINNLNLSDLSYEDIII